jgi:dTDP-4-dehydrorhamnose reductase
VHIDAHREDQLRWLVEVWRAAEGVRRDGAEIVAVTVWALLGSFDWNGLVCEARGYYEPGPFDVRAPTPRPTALATLVRSLAAGQVPDHPALHSEGWWRRPGRFFCKPVSNPTVVMPLKHYREALPEGSAAPILISGASGTLGRAFARACAERHLSYRLLTRGEMDIGDAASVEAALERHRPWAVINASGYVRIDDAEAEPDRCHRENAIGAAMLARHCAARGIALQTFSSDQVFSGESTRPWVESDPTAPLNAYGRSKADSRSRGARRAPGRDGGPDQRVLRTVDPYNFVAGTLRALAAGEEVRVADDERISPTYVPDLVKVCLDLLIDAESGLWHLANVGDCQLGRIRRARRHAGRRRHLGVADRVRPLRSVSSRHGRATASSAASAPR